jgi:tripartite-type tricarboxylate transporter receptor subunit TctC
MVFNRAAAVAAVLLLALTMPPRAAEAQAYPDRPVRLIVPFTPGGPADALGRIFSRRMSELWGQQVVVENRAGADGSIAAALVSKSLPDGYTLLLHAGSLVINASLYKNLGYDPLKDFTPISKIASYMLLVVVTPQTGINSMADLVAQAKARPGTINYASAGIGSGTHLPVELFEQRAGITLVHVPYKGTSEATNDLVAGHIQLMFNNPVSGLPQVKSGRVKAIAVTGAQRLPALPDLPTIAESGFPGYEAGTWFGISGPARMPADVVKKIYQGIVQTIATPEAKQQLDAQSVDAVGSTPEELAAFMQSEDKVWREVIAKAGIKAE